MQKDVIYIEAAGAANRRPDRVIRREGVEIICGSVPGFTHEGRIEEAFRCITNDTNKDKASYATMVCGHITGGEDAKRCSRVLAGIIREFAGDGHRRILVAGLGNPGIPADSLGARTAELIMPRRREKGALFALTAGDSVRLPLPLSTAEVVAMFASRLKVDLIIAVDALAARLPERMNAMIQVTDAGISPGSGSSNNNVPEQLRRNYTDGISRLCRDTMGADVLSIGVPTVICSESFFGDSNGIRREEDSMLLSALNVEREVSVFAAAVAGGINLFAAGL